MQYKDSLSVEDPKLLFAVVFGVGINLHMCIFLQIKYY
jgi:hypothetical protein